MTIEEFLDLDKETIQKRKEELRKRIPTIPGTEYLKSRIKVFDVQPWPFIAYLAHWHPKLLKDALNRYEAYDGANESQLIMEQLRERYIICNLCLDIVEKEKNKNDN